MANPPYIRHHRLSQRVKAELRALATRLIGKPLDGRAGYHIYFLLRALDLLQTDGRLAFIMPADTCEGVFAPTLWRWISSNYRIEAVVTFSPGATPFPDVDTNPVVVMIRNTSPGEEVLWAKCVKAGNETLKQWTLSGFTSCTSDSLLVCRRSLREALAVGLSRPPAEANHVGPVLGDFARVMHGIATGANHFFFLTATRAAALGIPGEFLIPAIGRTRDVSGDEITIETLNELRSRGRPTLLLCLNGAPLDGFPQSVRDYIRRGEAAGVEKRALISTRHPWYKMESRPAPPILFAYLGRRNAKFVRNRAGVVPLTGFLCVYPRRNDPDFVEKLWNVLRHPETIANLSLVGKSYGSGAIKVEPRALEKLPLPELVVAEVGLEPGAHTDQLLLPAPG